MSIEDRIFELSGHEPDASKVFDAVVEEYGLDRQTVRDLYVKLRIERGSPNLVAANEAIARLKRLSFL